MGGKSQQTVGMYNVASPQGHMADPVVQKKIMTVKERAVDWDDEDIYRVLEEACYDELVAINNILDGYAVKSGVSWSKCETKKKPKKGKEVAPPQTTTRGRGASRGRGGRGGRGGSLQTESGRPQTQQTQSASPARGGRGGTRVSRTTSTTSTARRKLDPLKPASPVTVSKNVDLDRTYKAGGTGPSMLDIIVRANANNPVSSSPSVSDFLASSTSTPEPSFVEEITANELEESAPASIDNSTSASLHAEAFLQNINDDVDIKDDLHSQQTDDLSNGHDTSTDGTNYLMEKGWQSNKESMNTFSQSTSSNQPVSLTPTTNETNTPPLLNHQMEEQRHISKFSAAPVVLPSGLLSDDQDMQLQFGNLGFGLNSTTISEKSTTSMSGTTTSTETSNKLVVDHQVQKEEPKPAESSLNVSTQPTAPLVQPQEVRMPPTNAAPPNSNSMNQSHNTAAVSSSSSSNTTQAISTMAPAISTADNDQPMHMPYGYMHNHFMHTVPYPYETNDGNAELLRLNQGRPMFYEPPFPPHNGFRPDISGSSSLSASSSSMNASGSNSKDQNKFESSNSIQKQQSQTQQSQQPPLQPGVPLPPAPGPNQPPQHYVGSTQYSAPVYSYPYIPNHQYPTYQTPATPAQFPYPQRIPQYYKPSPSAYPNMHNSLSGGYPNTTNVSAIGYHEEDYSKGYGLPQHFPFMSDSGSIPKGPTHHHGSSPSKPSAYSSGSSSASSSSSAQFSSSYKSQDYKYSSNSNRDSNSGVHYGGSNAAVAPPFPPSGQGTGTFLPFIQPPHMMYQGRNYP
jgi:hypothetical protein